MIYLKNNTLLQDVYIPRQDMLPYTTGSSGTYAEGYSDGYEDGTQDQKDKLASTAFTENGLYTREDGWNEVEVSVEAPLPVLEDKTVVISADTTTVTPSSGYDGMSAVTVDASGYAQTNYDNGFEDGFEDGYASGSTDEKDKLSAVTFTANTQVSLDDGGYSAVTVNVAQTGHTDQELEDAYESGYTSGQTDQKNLLTTTAFTENGSYQRENGWSGITVNIDTASTYNSGYTSGETHQKSLLVSTAFTENGEYQRENGYSAITVNVPTGQTYNVETNKPFTATSNGNYTITPSSGQTTKRIGYEDGVDFYFTASTYPSVGYFEIGTIEFYNRDDESIGSVDIYYDNGQIGYDNSDWDESIYTGVSGNTMLYIGFDEDDYSDYVWREGEDFSFNYDVMSAVSLNVNVDTASTYQSGYTSGVTDGENNIISTFSSMTATTNGVYGSSAHPLSSITVNVNNLYDKTLCVYVDGVMKPVGYYTQSPAQWDIINKNYTTSSTLEIMYVHYYNHKLHIYLLTNGKYGYWNENDYDPQPQSITTVNGSATTQDELSTYTLVESGSGLVVTSSNGSNYEVLFCEKSQNLGIGSFSANGTYSASTDNLDGYSAITVNVPQTGSTNSIISVTGNTWYVLDHHFTTGEKIDVENATISQSAVSFSHQQLIAGGGGEWVRIGMSDLGLYSSYYGDNKLYGNPMILDISESHLLLENGNFYVDDVLYTTGGPYTTGVTKSTNMVVFANSADGSDSVCGQTASVGIITIYDENDNIVAQYVPELHNGAACFYNPISDTYISPSGTGTPSITLSQYDEGYSDGYGDGQDSIIDTFTAATATTNGVYGSSASPLSSITVSVPQSGHTDQELADAYASGQTSIINTFTAMTATTNGVYGSSANPLSAITVNVPTGSTSYKWVKLTTNIGGDKAIRKIRIDAQACEDAGVTAFGNMYMSNGVSGITPAVIADYNNDPTSGYPWDNRFGIVIHNQDYTDFSDAWFCYNGGVYRPTDGGDGYFYYEYPSDMYFGFSSSQSNFTELDANGYYEVWIEVSEYEIGYESGYTDGYSSGYTSGTTDGFSIGYAAGSDAEKALLSAITFTANTAITLNSGGYSAITVNVPQSGSPSVLGSGSFSANGTYSASADNLDGYSVVTVNIPQSFSGDVNIGYVERTLTELNVPSGCTKIGRYAFSSFGNLTAVTIPNTVISTDAFAFAYNRSLLSVTLPNSLTNLGPYIFCDCNSLSSITIPNSITKIEYGAFQECKSLSSVTIPNSVTEIQSFTFYSCDSLSSVTIPNTITRIGGGAFQKCTSLTSVTIPSLVQRIEIYAFDKCTSLTDIYTQATTAPAIHSDAFRDMSSTGTVHYPSGSDYSSWQNNQYLSGWTFVGDL